MATLQAIIYNIANMRKSWTRSDDDKFTDRQAAFIINYYRATLIKQFKDKGKYLTGNLVQNLGRVELIKADQNEECSIVNCTLRVKNPLPKAIDTNSTNLITYVGPLNGSKSYQRTTYQRAIYDKYATYTSKQSKWFELGNYIYIINPPSNLLKYINIQGIFEDPTAANDYKVTCETGECFIGFDYEYPMSITLLDTIYKMMADVEFKIAGTTKADTKNDSVDD
jgi:hypothetical protein